MTCTYGQFVLFKLNAFIVVLLKVGVDAYVDLPTYFCDIYLPICLMSTLPKIINYNVFTFVSLEQGRTDEAVECTEGSVILWFETNCPACWFLLDW